MECYCVTRNKPIRREITKTANSNGSLFVVLRFARVLKFIVIGQYTINMFPEIFKVFTVFRV